MKHSFYHHYLVIMWEIVYLMKFLSKLISRSKMESWHQILVHGWQSELQNKAWQCHPQTKLGNQKQWCKGYFRNWAGKWFKILSPMTNQHWGILNQWRDWWNETDGWEDRQQMYWLTDRLIKVIEEKLHQIIFNLRPIWHLKLNPFWNERNLNKKVLISNQLFQ